MKKIILSVISCLLLCGILISCQNKKEDAPCACLTYDMTLSLEGDVLTGKQTVSFNNVFADNLENAVFHLYPNAYAENAKSKAYTGILPSYGGIEIGSVTVDGVKVEPTTDEDKQYLFVPLSGAAYGSKQTIDFTYSVTVPESRLRFGRYNENYLLSSFYPQLAPFKDGKFLTDPFSVIGDPLYSQIGDYTVSLACPSSLVVASGAKLVEKKDGGDLSVYTYSAKNTRDLAFAASPNFNVLSGKECDTEINCFFIGDFDGQASLDLARSAFKTYTENFGPSGLDVYSVVVAPFDFTGMEFSGIVIISDAAGEDVADVILHETAHQWWYNLVGSDPIRSSALDEGLTSFTSVYYYLLCGDEETFNRRIAEAKKVYTQYETLQKRRKTGMNLRLDGTIYDYTAYQYTMLMYYKACMMFNNLYELYGKDKTTACLRAFAEKYAHKDATMDDFVSVCNNVLKTDVSGLIAGWIGDGGTATTFAKA